MNKLYPHQVEGVKRALTRPFFALFMEQGTGKTPTAIRIVEKRYQKDGLHRWLILAPATLIYNWRKEWKKWGRLSQVRVVWLTGDHRADWIEELEQLRDRDYDFHTLKELRSKGLSRDNQPLTVLLLNFEKARILEPQLKRLKFQGLVVDESQRVKNRNAQVSKATYRVTRQAKVRTLLSGTPAPQGYQDLFMQFKIMDEEILGGNWGAFAGEYIRKGGYMGKEIVGYNNVEQLKAIVAENSYRVRLRDCVDLPPLQVKYLSCTLSGKAHKAYQELYEELYTRVPEEATRSRLKAVLRKHHIPFNPGDSYLSLLLQAEPFINVASCELTITQRIRLHQLTGGFLTLDSGEVIPMGGDKLKVTVDYLEDRKNPVVIFCQYVQEIKMLEGELRRVFPKRRVENYRDSKHRDQILEDFDRGEVDIIILQLHSGSVGLNFQRADTLLFYSLNNSAEDFTQAMKRIERPGQVNPMEVVILLAEGTIDEDILLNLEAKTARMEKLWEI